MLLVTGGGIDSEAAFWQRIRTKLKVPASTTSSSGFEKSREVGGAAKAGINFLWKAEAGLNGKIARSEQGQSTAEFDPVTGVELIQQVRALGKTLVVDDFHYIERGVQAGLVEQFKEAARAGCTLVVVSVPHRSDDVIRANPDLRGRVRHVEVTYWTEQELLNIAQLGFPALNIEVDNAVAGRLATESLSSPQLMQTLCLDLCRSQGIDSQLTERKLLKFGDQELSRGSCEEWLPLQTARQL